MCNAPASAAIIHLAGVAHVVDPTGFGAHSLLRDPLTKTDQLSPVHGEVITSMTLVLRGKCSIRIGRRHLFHQFFLHRDSNSVDEV